MRRSPYVVIVTCLLLGWSSAISELCRSADSGTIGCNDTIAGSISPAGDTDAYTLNVQAPGMVSIRIVSTSISTICYRLFAPGGGPIGSQQCGAAQFAVAAGTHTIQVEAATPTATGTYALTMQGVSGSLACGPALGCDQTHQEAIDCAGDTDSFELQLAAGEIVSLRIAPATTMCFTLFGPAGSPVGSQQCATADLTAAVSGTHTLVVAPNFPSTTVAYGLTRQDITPGSRCGSSVACGQTVQDQIESLGDVDAYTFDASSGGGIAVRMAPGIITSPICFRLFDPTGAPLGVRACDFKNYLIGLGEHLLLVEPSSSPATGGYGFTLEGVSAVLGCGQSLGCGQTIQGQIDQLGDEDSFTFVATAGDTVTVTIGGGAITPMCVRLYGPSGVPIGARSCNTTASFAITTTGLHTLLVEPASGATGGYSLGLQCPSCPDVDQDGHCDANDNCPATYNVSQLDGDGDDHGDPCDCAPADASAFALPSEVLDLAFASDGTLRWESAAPAAGSGTVHDLLRGHVGDLPVDGGPSEVCVVAGTAGTTRIDSAPVPSGMAFWYLVRGRNACGAGPYGTTSAGAPAISSACP